MDIIKSIINHHRFSDWLVFACRQLVWHYAQAESFRSIIESVLCKPNEIIKTVRELDRLYNISEERKRPIDICSEEDMQIAAESVFYSIRFVRIIIMNYTPANKIEDAIILTLKSAFEQVFR